MKMRELEIIFSFGKVVSEESQLNLKTELQYHLLIERYLRHV
jgi:hypothetical protein